MNISKDKILIKMAEKTYSRQKLAEASGVSYKCLTDSLARGRMTTENLGRIAHALECKVEELVEV